jgi:hypothetical protein
VRQWRENTGENGVARSKTMVDDRKNVEGQIESVERALKVE